MDWNQTPKFDEKKAQNIIEIDVAKILETYKLESTWILS